MEFSELNEAVKRMSIFVIPLEPGAKGNSIAQDGAKDGWTSFPQRLPEYLPEMRILGEQGDPAVRAFNELVSAYGEGRDAEFEKPPRLRRRRRRIRRSTTYAKKRSRLFIAKRPCSRRSPRNAGPHSTTKRR